MILLAMDVGHFSVISLSYYACLWHPDELRAAGAWVRARLGLGWKEAAPAQPAEPETPAEPAEPTGAAEPAEPAA